MKAAFKHDACTHPQVPLGSMVVSVLYFLVFIVFTNLSVHRKVLRDKTKSIGNGPTSTGTVDLFRVRPR